MVLYVGIDDTDSTVRMCTTYVAAELISRLEGYDLIGYPRLVRLNPNIPWKTRGNGAICLRLGSGIGGPFQVGEVRARPILAYPGSGPTEFREDLGRLCREVLLDLAELEDPDTQPAVVATSSRPGPGLYWRAVRDLVTVEEVEAYLSGAEFYAAPKGRRGLVGALAAIAWRPRDRTYEVLAYRYPEAWGTRRQISEEDVKALDRRFPTTFNNYDYETQHMAVAPNSPCPVLMGIRGDVPGDLPAALKSVRCEPVEKWLLFETNQGTDDHLVRRRVADLRPHTSAIVEGTVQDMPRTIQGGHALFSLYDGQAIDCVAYEPTKSFRKVVLGLRPGDRVRVYGSVRDVPRSLNVEKLEVIGLAEVRVKVANPPCPSCGRSMKSAGREAGYRCRRCGTRASEEEARFEVLPRSLRPGLYEPPVAARRHISKPLKRILRQRPVEAVTLP